MSREADEVAVPTNGLGRVIWRLSVPLIFVEATETLDHLIDSVLLARVGMTELGAIGVADAVMLLFLIAPLALVDGIQILTARRMSQRRSAAVGEIFNQGLLLVLLLGVASLVALKLFSSALIPWFVESDAVRGAVDSYLQLDAYSIPLVGVAFACGALLTSLGRTRALIPATILLVVVDVGLNYLFIFGKFGFPALGMRGAAVGSIGAELAVVVFLTVYVKRALESGRYAFFRFARWERRTTRLLGRISAPVAAQCVVGDISWFAFFVIIEHLGPAPLAIANIVFTCYLVFLIPTEGFSETACSMVSRVVGRNRGGRIAPVVHSTIGGAVIATAPLIVLAVIAPQWLAAVFSSDAALLAPSGASLRVVALTMLIAIPGQMWYTAVVGTGDTAAALGIELVSTLVMLGITWLVAIHLELPIALVWLSLSVTSVTRWVLSYGWIESGRWSRLEV